MATTVEIIIKGIAICYRKGDDWQVLFPIDKKIRGVRCHSVKFCYKKTNDIKFSNPVPLSESFSPIQIIVDNAAADPSESETQEFRDHVLSLTSARTHPKIQRKGDIRGKAVLLTIPKACFSVRNYLQDFPDIDRAVLHEVGTTNRKPLKDELTAHSVSGTITLNGGQLIVRSDALGKDFETDKDTSYILCFDNDCEEEKEGKNDMDMLYQVVEEPGKPNRKFHIGGLGRGPFTIKTEPPQYDKGKPCLVVKVDEPNDLP